jgi:hypothetical protein
LEVIDMAYEYNNSKGVKYFLHFKDVNLKGGRIQRIYYFARDIRSGALDSVPAGYKVIETERTGMPILKKA